MILPAEGLTMTNVQFYLAIGLPSFLVVLSWISNRSDAAQLRSEIAAVRGEVNQLRGEFNQLRSDMHKDMMQLLTQMVTLHERVAVFESRQS
jgi:TolA-binding protein